MEHPHLTGHPDELVGSDLMVSVASGGLVPFAFLDNAASTPAMVVAAAALNDLLPWYSSVHRGAGLKSAVSTAAYELARDRIARALGASTRQVTVFTKSTTEGLNRLASAFGAERATVVVSIMEHHANLLPWRASGCEVLYVGADSDGVIDEADLETKLASSGSGRRIVAISGVYNVTGYAPPIHRIARLAHEHGAQIVVDGAQLVAHRPINLSGEGDGQEIDYFVFSGHKVYAPFGIGVLVGLREDLDRAQPYMVGGGIVDLVTLDETVWKNLPDREEAGSPNVPGAVALAAALDRLQQLGRARVEAEERALTAELITRLRAIPGIQILGPTSDSDRAGVVSFVVHGQPHGLIAAALSHEYGIAVRNGCFCAHPAVLHLLATCPGESAFNLDRMRAHVQTGLPGAVRISLGIGNSLKEIIRVGAAVRNLAVCGPDYEYVQDELSGQYVARDSSGLPELPLVFGRPVSPA